jgi:AraC-like DNA-binding protein/quercetin dioxygenase-like cupin family protein
MEQVFLYNKILSHCTSEFSPILLGGLKIQPVVFHFTKENERKEVPVHQHRFAELSWMLNGNMEYKFGDELQVISSEEKNFIFIPPGTSHQRISQESNSTILGFLLDLTPQNKAGEKFFDAIVNFIGEHNFIFDNIAFINEFEAKILEQLNSPHRIIIGRINLLIYEFWFDFFNHYFPDYLTWDCNANKMNYVHEDLAGGVKDMIERNLSTDTSISSLAKKLNVPVRSLTRAFSEQTGESLGQYIIMRKLNAARKMLHNPRFSVKEIAYSLGFRSDAYFCFFFKRQTGMTPLEFSKSVIKE